MEVGRQELTNLALATLVMFLFFGMTTLLSLGFHRARRSAPGLRAAATGLLTYPNCTFLGLPLCRALFGDIAILYNAAAVITFNVLFFTVQYNLFTGKGFRWKNLMTPPVLSTVGLILMLLLGLHFPAPVQTVVSNTGAMITPLSLIIIGVMMSEHSLSAVLKEKLCYLITLLRNLVIPLLAMLVLRLIPIDAASRLCVLVYIACPCATLTTIYAIQNDMEPELCARAVLLSTLLFSLTLPVIITLGQRFLL